MRLVATSTVQSGTILAKAIYGDRGQILLNEGFELNERILELLENKDITYIYIKDERTDDILIQDPISQELKHKAVLTIESTFRDVQADFSSGGAFVIEKAAQKLKEVVRILHEEISSNKDLISLLSDVFVYDNYIFTHSFNVTMYSLAIGSELGLSPKDLETLGLGAILHDVGKLTVPTEVLFKPGKLAQEEYERIKEHADAGFQILRNIQTISLLVAHCAFQHHERLNGTGYPRGIKGDEILPFAKIIAVADVFDAVTSNRVYRKALLPHNGLEILYAGIGTLYDEKIVHAFKNTIAIYPIGISVELSDGRKGVVSSQNMSVSDRPVIRILEENGMRVTPYELDLIKELAVVIVGCNTTFEQIDKF